MPAYLPVPLEWRATTRQICGLFPWAVPGQLPLLGVPIGRHQEAGTVVCFDHVSWFLGKRIANPSMLVIARPGLGKSTLASKIMLGLAAQGYTLLVPGDTKPDYVELTKVLGGWVREVHRAGGAGLNPCDPGGMSAAARRIGGLAGATLLSEAIGRATVSVSGLIELSRRGQPVTDYEEAALGAALRLLYELDTSAPPTLPDCGAGANRAGRGGAGGGARRRPRRRLRRVARPAATLVDRIAERGVRGRVRAAGAPRR